MPFSDILLQILLLKGVAKLLPRFLMWILDKCHAAAELDSHSFFTFSHYHPFIPVMVVVQQRQDELKQESAPMEIDFTVATVWWLRAL